MKGSERHQAPPASPGAEEGRPPSPPLAPLRLPAASSAPPLLFPKSTTLTHDFPLRSWAPVHSPSPAPSSSRPTALYPQGSGSSVPCPDAHFLVLLATSLALLPEKPQGSRRSGVSPGHPLPAWVSLLPYRGLLTSAYRPMGPSECPRSADLTRHALSINSALRLTYGSHSSACPVFTSCSEINTAQRRCDM